MGFVNVFGPYSRESDGGGYSGYTVRQVINSADLSNTGLATCRLSFTGSSLEGLITDNVYIQSQGAGDVYDFSGTPVEVLFGGGSGFSIAKDEVIVSDSLTFTIAAATNYVVSWYVPTGSGAADGGIVSSGPTSALTRGYWKIASEAATVDVTGYTAGTAGSTYHLSRIEGESAGGGFFNFF